MIHKEPVSLLMLRAWTDGPKHVVSHYEADKEFRSNEMLGKLDSLFVGNTDEIYAYIQAFAPGSYGAIYLAGPWSDDAGVFETLSAMRPNLQFYKLRVTIKDDLGDNYNRWLREREQDGHATDNKEQDNRGYGANTKRSRKAGIRSSELF